jgi:hypothetical protein
LVGFGEAGEQTPAVVVEVWAKFRKDYRSAVAKKKLIEELRSLAAAHSHTRDIEHILIYPGFLPTDIRHNAKIFREKLGPWAQLQIKSKRE